MFVVLLRHLSDDLPVKLCKTFDEARDFAKAMAWMPTDHIREVFKTDISTPTCIVVVQYDESGDPVKVYHARSWEKEQDEADARAT